MHTRDFILPPLPPHSTFCPEAAFTVSSKKCSLLNTLYSLTWSDLDMCSEHPSIHPSILALAPVLWWRGGARRLFCLGSVMFLLWIADTSFNLQRLRPIGNRLERSAPEVSTLFWVMPTAFTVGKPRLSSNPALWICAFVWNKEINQIKWLVLIGSIPSSK